MDVTTAIQVAVAKADLILCSLGQFPWDRILLSFVLAAILMKVVRYL